MTSFAKLPLGSSGKLPAFRTTEVFTPSVPASRGFVGRETELLDLRTNGLDVPGVQIVVWGESGAGKSSLVNKALEDTGRAAVKTACTPDSTYESIVSHAFIGTGAFYVSESESNEVASLQGAMTAGSDLIGAKAELIAKYDSGSSVTRQPIAKPDVTPQRLVHELGVRNLSWVIEDFHKVAKSDRDRLAHDLKIFSDEGLRYAETRVIVLGVSESIDDLLQAPTNLRERLIDIPVPPLTNGDLGKIVSTGEELLNVDFSRIKAQLLNTSVGTASITHALALACCNQRAVKSTQESTVTFDVEDFERAVQSYARTRSSSLRSRFRDALKVHRKRQYDNTSIILRAMASLPEKGGTVGEILSVIRQTEPGYPSGNATTYLRDLQTEERGALVRKTAEDRFRFNEPLQHAFAKAYFGIHDDLEIGAGGVAVGNAWSNALSGEGVERAAGLRSEIEVEEDEFAAEDFGGPGSE